MRQEIGILGRYRVNRRIYTYVKIDISTGRVLDATWYDYDGPIALCDFSPDITVPPPPPVPAPSPEEVELTRQLLAQSKLQTEILQQAAAAAGGPLETEARELALQKLIAGLKGELPVDPALERELGKRETQTTERLFRQLGPGFETGTPGIETRAEEFGIAEALRGAARRGELDIANLIQSGFGQRILQQLAAGLSGPTAQGFGQVAQTRLLPFSSQLDFQSRIAAALAQGGGGGGLGSLLSGAGSLFGGIGGLRTAFCFIVWALYGPSTDYILAAYWVNTKKTWRARLARFVYRLVTPLFRSIVKEAKHG